MPTTGQISGTLTTRDDASRTAADATEKEKEQARRLQQATAQLHTLNQELDSFTYSVSHDLRAPLRHVSGFARILADEYGPALPEEAQILLTRILQGTQRMGSLIDDLLGLARLGQQELHLQFAGLDTVVREVLSDLRPQCEGRSVLWKIGALPLLECDSALVKQVFLNLLANGLKFTRPRTQAVIEVGQTANSRTPILFVRDNGVGFNMQYAGKLFGVFQRLHRAEDFEGTGVGLATAQRVIRKHGGRIWTESELDKGATFYFTLSAPAPGQDEDSAKKNTNAITTD
jgi:light-regulated signal transduction histidine kinase (bacteriophytochrome)